MRAADPAPGLACVLIAALAASSPASASEFVPLPDLAGGAVACGANAITPDGLIIVGHGTGDSGARAVRWVGDLPQALGVLPGHAATSTAIDVSADGGVVVGLSGSFPSTQAFRWQGGSMSGLGFLPGFGTGSSANGVSADGSVIAGWCFNGSHFRAFRYASGTMSSLNDIPGSFDNSAASDLSDDGVVSVGRGISDGFTYEACRWVLAGSAIAMADLPGGRAWSEIEATNSDGTIHVGYANDDGTSTSDFGIAARWVGANPPESLGDLPGGLINSYAFDLTDDGRTVVGYGRTAIGTEAFIWREGLGIANLRVVLQTEYGLDLTGWTLTSATSITPSGSAVAGHGINPNGQSQAWVARLSPPPPSCSGDFNGSGNVDTADLVYFLGRFGQPIGPDEPADFNDDGAVSTPDLVTFLGRFGQAC